MTQEPDSDGDEPSTWLDRHLGKVVGVALFLCLAALVGRALMG